MIFDLILTPTLCVCPFLLVHAQYTPSDKNRKPHEYAALPPPPPEFTVVSKQSS